jgi:leader peptidase (prepilin peptidase) / N-methyltransferase
MFMPELPMVATLGIAFILGAMLGSFLNVVIYRLPLILDQQWRADCLEYLELPAQPNEAKVSLWLPSSQCPGCGHSIRPWHNIPIFGYLLLRGRCTDCGVSISPVYPLVEALTGILTALVIWRFGASLEGLAAMCLTWSLIALTGIDLKKQILPDSITLPLLWAGLIANAFGLFTDIYSSLWGAVGGYLSLWSVYWLFKLVTGKEGMGYGDFKLLAALGAWLGWQYLPTLILCSSVVGIAFGIVIILMKRQGREIPIAFGPYLATAGWICLFFGETALSTTARIFG